jgi:hypothetical protein
VSLVVDASVAFKWFLFEVSHASQAIAVLPDGATLISPDLLIAEVCNAAWRSARLGRISRAQMAEIASPISSWPGLTRPSTALRGLDKDVDARIKSAQDEVKLFSISTTQVRHAGKFLSDSPAVAGKGAYDPMGAMGGQAVRVQLCPP